MFFIFVNTYGINIPHDILPDTVTILGDKFYPPYEQLNDKGQPEGFTIDLIKEVMKRLNIPYTIKLTSRDEMMKEVRNGNINLYLGMTYTEERSKFVKYGPVLDYAFKCAVFRKDHEHISRFQQLQNKRVVTGKGTYTLDILNKAGYNAIPVDNFIDAFKMLNEGKCDAVMCNREIADYMKDTYYNNLDYYDLEFQPEKFCLTGNNENLLTKINLIIYDLKNEGIYNKLVSKWFIRDHKAQTIRKFYFYFGIASIICLVLFIFNTLLRMKVKKAKRKLENESKRLSLSVRAGNIIVWGYDVRLKRYFNIYCNYFSPEGDTLEKEMKNYHPEDRQLLEDTLKRASEGHSTKEPIHVRMDRTHSNNWRFIEKEMIPVFDDKGNINRVIGTHKDVTNEIEKQKKIDELLKQYSILFNNSTIGTQLYDKNGILVNMNAAAAKIFGIANVDHLILQKKNIFDNPNLSNFLNRVHPLPSYHIMELDFKKYKNDPYFSESTKNDGGIHFIETHITPVYDEEDILSCIIVNNYDLTEQYTLQKQVEDSAKRIDYILKSSGIIIWNYDIQTHTAIAHISRNNKVEEVELKDIVEYVDETDKKNAIKIIQKMDNREIGEYNVRIKFTHTNFSSHDSYLSFHATPIRDKDGTIESYNGVCVDVTDLIETQIQLQKEKEEALKADKLKSAFLANMSHEIRTPLNAIVGFSEMMQYADNEADRTKFYKIIKINNELLLRLINDVLDLSRIESGNIEMINEPFNLENMFDDIYKSFANQMTDKQVKFICETPKTDCFIDTDKARLTQVVTNFINNAKKFTNSGYIKIGYNTTRNGIRMFVTDTGLGIPKDKQKNIFDRFEKVDTFMQGTGLGLSICKAIIQIYKGKIGVNSELGKGSTFWAWIPIKYKIVQKRDIQ
jgi:PAS domain S-box-containing protein